MAKKFPDLTGDGKVTKKDILKARGVIKKANGGSVQGPPANPPMAPSSGGYDRNRMPVLGAAPGADRSSGTLVRPSLRGGMPGIKVKSNFAGGGKVSSASKRADGRATQGKTKGRFV